MKQLQNTKKGTQDLLALSKVQYKQLTGLEWEGVEIIREPSLEFSLSHCRTPLSLEPLLSKFSGILALNPKVDGQLTSCLECWCESVSLTVKTTLLLLHHNRRAPTMGPTSQLAPL